MRMTYSPLCNLKRNVILFNLIFALSFPIRGNSEKAKDGTQGFTLKLHTNMNLVSIPIVLNRTAIGEIMGTQLSGGPTEMEADRIWKWDPASKSYEVAWLIQGGPNDRKWWNSAQNSESGMTLSRGEGFWIQNRHGGKKITFVGKSFEDSDRPIRFRKGLQLIGSPYPVEVSLSNSHLRESGASGSINELDADRIWEWDPVHQNYKIAWLIEGAGPLYDGMWWDSNAGSETTIKLKPGVGYWFEIRNLPGHRDFFWNIPNSSQNN